jgi:hypothetical protein
MLPAAVWLSPFIGPGAGTPFLKRLAVRAAQARNDDAAEEVIEMSEEETAAEPEEESAEESEDTASADEAGDSEDSGEASEDAE